MLRKKRYGMLAIVAFMMILLSGCFHVRQEVTLQAGDNWDALIEIRFPKSTVDQIGEEMLMESQSDFEAERAEAEAKGVKATFDGRKENNGDVVWEITYSGQGLYLLNEVMFEGTPAFTADADGRVNFRYDASDITELTSMDGSYTFVLNAGAVYSSNATETKGNTLTWQDPTARMRAEVGTRAVGGGLPSWLIIGVGIVLGIVLLAGLAVMLLYMRGKQMQQRGPSM